MGFDFWGHGAWKKEREMRYGLLKECPRCGEEHTRLAFKKLKTTVQCQPIKFKYWAMCPVTLQPLLCPGIKKKNKDEEEQIKAKVKVTWDITTPEKEDEPEATEEKTCQWSGGHGTGLWHTECGARFECHTTGYCDNCSGKVTMKMQGG